MIGLAAIDVPPLGPSDIAGGISKQGLYYLIGVLCVVVVGLFWRMLADRADFSAQVKLVQDQRIADRDRFQDKLEQLAREGHALVSENGKSFWAVQRELMELKPRRGGKPGGEPPPGGKPP